MDVVNSIQERIVKYGRLSEDLQTIKRKQHNNDDFYEQDDFIDDPEEDATLLQSMARITSKYTDYFCY